MRCFIAIPLPENVIQNISTLQLEMKAELCSGIRWTKPDSIHLTLNFLGEIPEQKLDSLIMSFNHVVENKKIFTLSLLGLGVYPHVNSPKVIWMGIKLNKALFALQQNLEFELVKLGFERERRKFSPHLTFGRVGNTFGSDKVRLLKNIISEKPKKGDLMFEVNTVLFMKSELKPEGAVYSILSTSRLR